MTTDTYMTTESTSKVHGHWPANYAVANINDSRGTWVLHAESSVHSEDWSSFTNFPLLTLRQDGPGTPKYIRYITGWQKLVLILTGASTYGSSGNSLRMASRSSGILCPSARTSFGPWQQMELDGKWASARTGIRKYTRCHLIEIFVHFS